jgi:predicted RNA-binding Zn-ribbon protein involved in translation (DUF1610 family)
MSAEIEATYPCPECGESIVVPVDLTAGITQEYVEDCPICCHPNLLRITLHGDEEASIEASAE